MRSPFRFVAGASAYAWQNDGDRNLFTDDGASSSSTLADVERVRGVELSGGLRGHGLSIDAAWQRIASHTIDTAFDGGLYQDGLARFYSSSLEAGYMVLPGRLEVLGAFDTLDVASRSSTALRPAFGVNWYVYQHRLKFQFMHRETFNVLGVRDARAHNTTAQAQLAF